MFYLIFAVNKQASFIGIQLLLHLLFDWSQLQSSNGTTFEWS